MQSHERAKEKRKMLAGNFFIFNLFLSFILKITHPNE